MSALRDALAINVPVMRNGKREMMPRGNALVESVLADFSKATMTEKLRLLRFFAAVVPLDPAQMDRTASPEAIAEFVRGLAEGLDWPEGSRQQV